MPVPMPAAAEILGPALDARVPEVRAIFVSSINGAAAVEGVSGGLGNATDFEVLLAARTWADVVLVGAGTVRAEDYGGVKLSEKEQSARRARGQSPIPPLAIIGRTLDFPASSRVLKDAAVPPVLVRLPGGPELPVHLEGHTVLELNDFSLRECIDALRDRGFTRILCEGGPTIYAQLLAEDYADVLHWTIDPSFVSHPAAVVFPAPRDASGTTRLGFELTRVAPCPDGVLFLRYDRRRAD